MDTRKQPREGAAQGVGQQCLAELAVQSHTTAECLRWYATDGFLREMFCQDPRHDRTPYKPCLATLRMDEHQSRL